MSIKPWVTFLAPMIGAIFGPLAMQIVAGAFDWAQGDSYLVFSLQNGLVVAVVTTLSVLPLAQVARGSMRRLSALGAYAAGALAWVVTWFASVSHSQASFHLVFTLLAILLANLLVALAMPIKTPNRDLTDR